MSLLTRLAVLSLLACSFVLVAQAAPSDCPCAQPAWCQPLNIGKRPEVFAFVVDAQRHIIEQFPSVKGEGKECDAEHADWDPAYSHACVHSIIFV
jgi:hypothetical protein